LGSLALALTDSGDTNLILDDGLAASGENGIRGIAIKQANNTAVKARNLSFRNFAIPNFARLNFMEILLSLSKIKSTVYLSEYRINWLCKGDSHNTNTTSYAWLYKLAANQSGYRIL
jgi:hypothetical protein